MSDQPLESRVQPKENPNLRWLMAIPVAAVIGVMADFNIVMENRDQKVIQAFQAQYGQEFARRDINGDGTYVWSRKYLNPNTGNYEVSVPSLVDGKFVLIPYKVED